MGNYPELAIFRRFRSAGTLDLLYQQASLQRAIRKWQCAVEEDEKDSGRREFDFDFWRLQNSVNDDAARTESAQWRAWCEISEKLDVYCELVRLYCGECPTDYTIDEKILRLQNMCNLAEVDDFQLRDLQTFLAMSNGGDGFLNALEEKVYQGSDTADLVSMAHAENPDWFTGLVRGRASRIYHILTRGNRSGRTVRVPRLAGEGHLDFTFIEHSDESIQRLSRVLYAVLTSAMVAFAILTLNWVDSFGGRLSLVLVHSLIFTLGMAFLTHVKPVELFAAAAAYAAVLVVFASGSFGLTTSGSTS